MFIPVEREDRESEGDLVNLEIDPLARYFLRLTKLAAA
jgi:hypothetical protein